MVMNYRNLFIFSIITAIIVGIPLSYLSYRAPIDHNELVHESFWVTECIPAGPDDEVLEVGLTNGTHTFSQRTCQWIDS